MLFLCTHTPGQPWQLVGYLWCNAIAPTADYTLAVAMPDGSARPCASLKQYSRWSEPACALVARLLAQTPAATDTLATPAPRECELDIRIGRDLEHSRRIEHVNVRRANRVIFATRTDDYLRVEHLGDESVSYVDLAALLTHACGLAAWGPDGVPSVPEPLSKVPMHRGPGGRLVVRAADIPEHPRLHFEASRLGGTQPLPGTYYAHDWLAFIGA